MRPGKVSVGATMALSVAVIASLGYRLARNAGVIASWFTQEQEVAEDSDGELLAVRLWWAF